jgi:hypothetical protein
MSVYVSMQSSPSSRIQLEQATQQGPAVASQVDRGAVAMALLFWYLRSGLGTTRMSKQISEEN